MGTLQSGITPPTKSTRPLVEEETTALRIPGLYEAIAAQGLFLALSPLGAATIPDTKVGGRVDRVHLTQVGRVLAELKVRHIPVYSPEAQGRMEHMFGPCTSGFRLLRRHGMATLAAASRYLRELYIAEHNRRFTVSSEGALSCRPSPAARCPVHSPRARGRQLQPCALRRVDVADPRAAPSTARLRSSIARDGWRATVRTAP
jgi:hypothetical protein